MLDDIIVRCRGISMSHFLNTPYKEQDIKKIYVVDGFANRASKICHYCTINTLKNILDKECLRFSDVRFLNDSTEFVEVIRLIKSVISEKKYTLEFKKLILESTQMKELKEYRQSYIGVSRDTNQYEKKMYRTYTCSFSTEKDSLSMWNYYAADGDGVNILFDNSWNMFEGSEKTEVNIGEKLKNEIIIYRGLVIYKDDDKKKCLREMLNRLQDIYREVEDNIEGYKEWILFAFKDSVNHMRCFFKNKNFEFENEYRIVLKIPEELLVSRECNDDIVEKGQFKRGNILIPYIDYKFKKESIKQITLNPYVNEENSMFKLSVEEVLWNSQMTNVKIVDSKIPIRKYS